MMKQVPHGEHGVDTMFAEDDRSQPAGCGTVGGRAGDRTPRGGRFVCAAQTNMSCACRVVAGGAAVAYIAAQHYLIEL